MTGKNRGSGLWFTISRKPRDQYVLGSTSSPDRSVLKSAEEDGVEKYSLPSHWYSAPSMGKAPWEHTDKHVSCSDSAPSISQIENFSPLIKAEALSPQ